MEQVADWSLREHGQVRRYGGAVEQFADKEPSGALPGQRVGKRCSAG
jgi:hypothetical protein